MRITHVKALSGTSLAAVGLALFSTPAFAQDADCSALEGDELAACEAEAAADAAAAPTEVATDDAIVITGSRLRRNETTSVDPVQIISPELSLAEGDIDTAEVLQQSPLAAGSTQITTALSSNFVTDGGPGAQTLSLRGLGANRTLILVNGRRAGPAGTRGAVSAFDLNVIPTAAISSVEILKTGASSVYGSDAVAGVVNLITNTEFDGIDLRAFTSLTQEGGGDTYSISGVFGKTFDRGHIQIGADYFKRDALKRGDRDFLACGEDYVFTEPNGGGIRTDLIDPRDGQPVCGNTFGPLVRVIDVFGFGDGGGLLLDPRSADLQYNDAGDRFDEFLNPVRGNNFYEVNLSGTGADVNGVIDPIYAYNSEALINDESERSREATVFPEIERYTIFADAAFELTPGAEIFVEGLFNRRETANVSERQLFFTTYNNNAFGAFGVSDPVNATVDLEGNPYYILPVIPFLWDTEQEVDYYRGVVGLRGSFEDLGAGGWLENAYYEAYYQYSRSDGTYRGNRQIAADAIEISQFRTEPCAPGQVTSYRGVPCVDIDFTDPRILNGEFTPEEENFLFFVNEGNTIYTQNTFEAVFGNTLVELPAGPVGFVLGTQIRTDEINDTPGQATIDGQDFAFTQAGITAGSQDTVEFFGEIEVPLIFNTPGIQELTINAAARVTSVSAERDDGLSSEENGNWTYKLGANWAVTDFLKFRATYGTSYRAPALFEQFLGNQTGFQFPADPCEDWAAALAGGDITQEIADNCAAQNIQDDFIQTSSTEVASVGGIELDLESETSTAWTLSAIFTPDGWFWDGFDFSATLDYVNIEVENQIAQLGASNILGECYTSENFPNEPLCTQFTRDVDPSTGELTQVNFLFNPYLNIESQRNEAIDLTLRSRQDLGDLGSLSFIGQMTWQLVDEFTLFDGFQTTTNGEVGDPHWVGDFNLTWALDSVAINYGVDVIGGTNDEQDVLDAFGDLCAVSNLRGGIACPIYDLSEQFYHSISAQVNVNENLQLTAGMSNIFNTDPPLASTVASPIGTFGQVPNLGTYYDYLGRRFFAQLRVRF